MPHTNFRRFSVFSLLILTFSAFGCGADIETGGQLAGQRCFTESDCVGDLTCYQRTCVPPGSGGATLPDSGNNGVNNGANNGANNGVNNGVVDFGFDGGMCEEGVRRCISETEFEICTANPDGTTQFHEVSCDTGFICDAGACVRESDCVDNDGDGYGRQCPAGPDCLDSDPLVNPGAEEDCATPIDDNCNGEINEGCDQCCPMGCPAGEFCDASCACTPFDEDVCEFQNQPCDEEGETSNGFFCTVLGGTEARCYGICDKNASDPSSTCPEANSICAFGNESQGVCITSCNLDAGCGSPTLGCLPSEGSPQEGFCFPANPANDLGDDCNADRTFDCVGGAICVNFQGGNVGTCQQACRPWANPGTETDCNEGHCLAISENTGLCTEDNDSSEGQPCSPEFTTCNEDSVACYPSPMGPSRCRRTCRLAEGDADCDTGSCRQIGQQNDEVGVCLDSPVPG